MHVCIHFTVVYPRPEDNRAITSLFPPHLDLSPPVSQSQYTSKSRPLTIPCSIPAHISWGQINDTGIKEVHWHFIPKPGSSPQRLFSLSVGNPMTWKADQDRGLRPVSEPKKGDLSLIKNRGTEEDEGDYVCALEFKNGVILNRTVHVQVLRRKSKQTSLYKPSSVLHSHWSYEGLFACSFVIAVSSFIFLMSSFFSPS